MAATRPVQAEVQVGCDKTLKSLGLYFLRGDAGRLFGRTRSLFADLGMTMIVPAQGRRDEPGRAIANRTAIDAYDWQNNLTG